MDVSPFLSVTVPSSLYKWGKGAARQSKRELPGQGDQACAFGNGSRQGSVLKYWSTGESFDYAAKPEAREWEYSIVCREAGSWEDQQDETI